ncbi:hypothetical protein Forpe1208_v010970 [Fusarium oxysporum f. sp. rapae]|uniref:Uncharacterized protein n=1 Tax=Fusarium oxysporum f. sp. rapae TaxID=485398 RepID=A0A8J5NW76_FUSOX|nr:hypothetical protein Forpe1208_v010970 [Fusarium oxysporum f. sp. rapae]
MNGTEGRESLSSDCIIKCMFDAYANEGDAFAVRMSPNLGYSDWGAFSNLNAIRKGDYEFSVVPWLQYGLLLRDDVAVGIPRSGGTIDDKCALDALSTVEVVGYEFLAWRPYCEEALPFMDRAGNNLPIIERPPRKSPEELGDTVEDSTI